MQSLKRLRPRIMDTPATGLKATSLLNDAEVPWWRRYTRWRPTSRAEGEAAEKKLLSLCRTPMELRSISVGEGEEQFMHTISGGEEASPPLVCLPGYGAGASFYFRNFDGLAKQFRLHLVDLLGTGMSGRPGWMAETREEAENFFVDSLSAWRKEMGMPKMILMGHSLGGYIAATYALRHPEDVEHLILVCPAGMAIPPPEAANLPKWAEDPWSFRGQFARMGRRLWNNGSLTPGSVIRTLGPFGPRLVKGYAKNRFREGTGLSEEEVEAFGNYFFHITAAKGSGEYALSHFLGPFAWARHPLEGRLHKLQVPCSLIYGESDWMKPESGKRILESMQKERGKLSSSDLQYDVIQSAGHYPFMDQPEIFLQRVLKQTQTYLERRGAKAVEKAREGRREADIQAAKAVENISSMGKEGRDFDL